VKLNKLVAPFFLLIMLSIAVVVFPTMLRGSLPTQQSGVWTAGPQMSHVRVGATSTVMFDGRVLIAGGKDESGEALSSVDIIDAEGAITVAPAMNVARADHAAVWLYDGYVLVSGGTTRGGGVTNTAELYDPLSNSWTLLPSVMSEPRTGHTATNLLDGRVLISGGSNGSATLSTIETFSIVDETFSFAGVMSSARENHAAAALLDGRVLLIGGKDADGLAIATTQIFNAETNSIEAGPALNEARQDATATTLLDGTVLVAGGRNPQLPRNGVSELASVELIDMNVGASRTLPVTMSVPRANHFALLLADNNQVVLVGGESAGAPSSSVDLYTPWTSELRPTGAMEAARAVATGANLEVPGRAIVAGGSQLNTTELYAFATVKTDRTDYLPDMPVNITGTGWVPGESVHVNIVNNDITRMSIDTVANGWGNISDSTFAPIGTDLGETFYLTATGSQSTAQTKFTDGTLIVTVTGPGTVTGSPTALAPPTCTSASGNCSVTTGSTETLTATGNYVSLWTGNKLSNMAGCGVGQSTCSFTPGNGSNVTMAVTFAPAPTLSSLSPASANYGYSGNVVVTGTNFIVGTTKIVFGGTQLTTTCTSTTSCSAPVPARGVGSYAVNVTNGTAANSGTQNFSITQVIATVSLSGLTATYNGSTHPATVTTVPAGLTTNVTYNGSTTAPTNAGNYAVVATITDPIYTGSATGTLTISKASATVTLSNLNQTYNGSGKSATAITSPVGLSTSITYDGVSTLPITVGDHAVVATIADPNYTGSTTGTLTISKATATVTLSNLNQTYTGSGKSATAVTSPAGLSTSITYDGSSTLPITAGDHAVVATITDPDYTGSTTGTLTISKATASIAFSNNSQTYDGTAKSITVTTTPPSLATSVTYDGSSTLPITAGDHAVVATITDPNYTGSTTATLTISKASATIAITNVNQTYDASPKSVTITTTPLNVATTVTYGGSSTPPTNAGNYAVVTTINDSNYTATPANDTLVIAKATSSIVLGNLNQTYDGNSKPIGVTTTPTNLAITITYDGNSAAPTDAGTYPIVVTSNDPNYTGSASGSLTITKATAAVTLGGLSRTFDGSPKAATASTVPAGLVTSITYEGSATAPSAVGSYAVVANVTDSNYVGSASGTLTIDPAAATVVLGNLTATYDGTAKSVSVTTTPIGLSTSITYNGSTIAPTNAGTYAIVATITDPNLSGTANGSLTIGKADQTITFGALSSKNVTDAPFTVAATSSSTLPVSFSASGTCSVVGSTVTINDVGSCSIAAIQAGDSNYNAATSVPQSFTIGGGVPAINWATPQAIVYGTPIGATQYTAAATYGGTSLAGTYDYSPAAGTVLGVGVHTLNVTFHPTDSSYNSVNGSVQLTVTPATVAITAPNLTRAYGDANPVANPAYGAFVNGESSAVLATPAACGSSATAASRVGTYAITCSGATAGNYQFTYAPGVLTVTTAPLSVTPNNASRPQGQANPAFTGTITGIRNSDPITATYSTTAITTSAVGAYPITAALSDGGSGALSNYAVTLNTGTLTVTNNKPDLVEALTVLTQSPLAGGQLKFVDTASNIGGTTAAGSVTRVYLVSGTARLTTLVARSEPSIAAGASGQPITTAATLPANLFGNYSVVACSDDNSSITESSETNNCTSVGIAVGAPDLSVTSFAIPSTAVSGGSITVTDSVVNIGVADAVASVNRFYLVSGTTKLSVIGTRTVAALKAGTGSGLIPTTLTLPTNISGSYTIQVCADDTLAVFESDETNNCRSSSAMSVGAADMVVRSVAAPSNAISGASITLVDTTANQGIADARASVTRFYLVSGTTRVAVLGTRSVGVLATGASSGPASTSLALPTNIVGTYTVQACADDTLTVSESDENNNCASSSSLTVAGADMTVSSISVPNSATVGGSITVTDTTVNRGPADARASVTRFYLLNGSTRVAVLGTRNVAALTNGSISGPAATLLALPAKTTGTFTIQACADDTLTVSESDEGNNCMGSTTLTITK
jgi:hypothetical protein